MICRTIESGGWTRGLMWMLATLAPACGEPRPAATDATSEAASSGTETSGTATTGPTATSDSTEPPTTEALPTEPTTEPPTTAATTDAACEPRTIELLFPGSPVEGMLVIDRSPAMMEPWDLDGDPGTAERPRWASVRAALQAVLPPVDHVFTLGLALYPGAAATAEYGAPACAFDPDELLAPAPDSTAELLAALPELDAEFVGAAPLGAAVSAAFAAMGEVEPGGYQYVVVVTASAPNCGPDAADDAALMESLDPQVLAAAAGLDPDVQTLHVVAVGAAAEPSPVAVDMRPDDVALADYLDELALAGGFNPAFNAADEQELVHAVDLLFQSPDYTCTVYLDLGPDEVVGAVRVAGQSVPQVGDCQSGDGWHMPSPTEIEMCGSFCQLFIESSDLRVDVACVQ